MKKSIWEKLFGRRDDDIFDEEYEEGEEYYEEDEKPEAGDDDEENEDDGEESDDTSEPTRELPINLIDKGGKYLIEAFVPGAKIEDIDVTVTRELISISLRVEREEKIKERDLIYNELTFGKFTRSMILPAEVEAEEAEADIKDGILTITVPKIDKKRKQKVSIKKR